MQVKRGSAGMSIAEAEDSLKDRETPKMEEKADRFSVFPDPADVFLHGTYDVELPVPSFLEGNHVAMGLIQLLLTTAVMVINQKFFISGFKGLIHRAPNMDTLVALGAGASYGYSLYALFAMTDDRCGEIWPVQCPICMNFTLNQLP